MSFLGGLASGLVKASPYISSVVAQRAASERMEREQALKDMLMKRTDARAQDQADLAQRVGTAQIGNLTARANSANEGQWGNPFSATDEQGNPVLVQQHKQTGELRRAALPSASPAVPPVGAPSPSAASSDAFAMKPWQLGEHTVGGPLAGPSALPDPQAPTQQGPTAGGLRPFVKPSAINTRIDPNSPEGIEAAGKKADAAARARAQYQQPKTPGSEPLVQVQGPNGPIWVQRSQAAGKAVPEKAAGGMTGGMGSGGIGGLARTASGITEMEQAHGMMADYENKVQSGQAKMDGLDYFKGQMAKMYDAHGKIDQAVHSATFANLNKVNPDLANYLRAGEAWALADGTISGRTSDFRTKLDAFVSSLGPNAGGQQIANTQKMRGTRLAELQKFQPAMEAAAQRFLPGGQPATAPSVAGGQPNDLIAKYQAAVAHMKKQGKSAAEIQQTLGPPPGGE